VAVILQKSSPLFLFFFGRIPIGVDQGFDIFKVGSIERVDAKSGLGKKIVKNEVVLMGMGGDQIVNVSLVLKLEQLIPVTGGINDCPISVIDQYRVAKRILTSPNKFNVSFDKIEHRSILAVRRVALPGNEIAKTFL
jgi:hypothetical protein